MKEFVDYVGELPYKVILPCHYIDTLDTLRQLYPAILFESDAEIPETSGSLFIQRDLDT